MASANSFATQPERKPPGAVEITIPPETEDVVFVPPRTPPPPYSQAPVFQMPTLPSNSQFQDIEYSLSRMALSNGVVLHYNRNQSAINPLLSLNGAAGVNPRSLCITSETDPNYCPALPACIKYTNLPMSFKQNGMEVMSLKYPTMNYWCCGSAQERIVDIFVPGREERIGFIKISAGGMAREAVITNCLTNKIFVIGKECINGRPAIVIADALGSALALGRATSGSIKSSCFCAFRVIVVRHRMSWEIFDLLFTGFALRNLSVVDRALILAAFNLWVVDMKEEETKSDAHRYMWQILLIVGFLFVILIWCVTSGSSSSSYDSSYSLDTSSDSIAWNNDKL